MAESALVHADITHSIIGAYYDVYRGLGFGYLESLYAAALERKLRDTGHAVIREFAVRVFFEGHEIGFHRLDLVVDERVVVEVKSTQTLHPIARRQLFNYLRATNLEVGLLLHFGARANHQRIFAANADKLRSNTPPLRRGPPRSR